LDWRGELVAGVLMGSAEVIGHWKGLLAKQANGDLRGEIRRFGVVSWEEIIAAIEKEWRQPWQELRRKVIMDRRWLSGLPDIELG
jgi:hypothetical protein